MHIADQPIADAVPVQHAAEPTFEIEQTIIDLVTVVAGASIATEPGRAAWTRLRQLAERLQSD